MHQLLTIAVLLIGSVVSSPNANRYFDSILQGPLQNHLRMAHLDPAALPNFVTHFEDKVAIIGKVKGEANYTNGQLSGLGNAVRFTECQGPTYGFGHMNCSLALNFITTNYSSTVKYGKLPKFDVKARGNITRTVLFVDIVQNYNQLPRLNIFQVAQMGQVQPKFTGLGGPLNKFLKVLEDGYISNVAMEFYSTLTQRFQYALGQAAAQVQFPMQ